MHRYFALLSMTRSAGSTAILLLFYSERSTHSRFSANAASEQVSSLKFRVVGAGSARPLYFTAVLTLTAFILYSFCSLSILTFCRSKSYKNARHSKNSRSVLLLVSHRRTLGRLLFVTHSLSFKHRGQKDSLSTH